LHPIRLFVILLPPSHPDDIRSFEGIAMIKTESTPTPYLTQFTNGTHTSQSDCTPDKGGGNAGFRPHELLEAALASCMNMTVQMAAKKHTIPLAGVSVTVTLNRSQPEEPTFEYQVFFPGELSAAQQERLLASVRNCPVRNTLSKSLQFKLRGSQAAG
jgi:putative redox protein